MIKKRAATNRASDEDIPNEFRYECGWCEYSQHGRVALALRREDLDGIGYLYVAVCPRCSKPTLFFCEGALSVTKSHQFPAAVGGQYVEHLPDETHEAWVEARRAYQVGAYTACELMCRKLLMNMAVDRCGADPGLHFVQYVEVLVETGEIPKGLRGIVDRLRRRGNAGTHELPSASIEDAQATMTITQKMLEILYEIPGEFGEDL